MGPIGRAPWGGYDAPMSTYGYVLFTTSIGPCGIVWGRQGIVGVQLPENREAETRTRLLRRFPSAEEASPPPAIRRALEDIAALLHGDARDLRQLPLDMTAVPPFHRQVYEVARDIAPGQTLTYGEIARRLGVPGAARAVGQALGRNPFALIVPCHRVLAAGGRIGGFSARGGVPLKVRLLAIEDGQQNRTGELFGAESLWDFEPEAALQHLRQADPALGRLIDAVGPFAMPRNATASVFHALAEAIVYQQLTGKAAATIYARLCALFPNPHRGPTAELILRTSEDKLRGAGLSNAKFLSLRDLARKTVDGELPTLAQIREQDDDAVIERLTAVRGIGRWTVEMLLMFRLGRPDILPVDDYGIRKGYTLTFGQEELPSPKALAEYGRRWAPYRTVASWYLWQAVERARQ